MASYFDSYYAKHMIDDDELIITEDGHVTASSEMDILQTPHRPVQPRHKNSNNWRERCLFF